MPDNDRELEFDEVWRSLEEQDTTGAYKRAREMAGIAREQLEYAYNSGYEAAKAKYRRPQGEWIELPKAFDSRELPCKCSLCGHILSFMNYYPKSRFCPDCGADMQKGDNNE